MADARRKSAVAPNAECGLSKNGCAKENREVRFVVEAGFPVVGVMGCQLGLGAICPMFRSQPRIPEMLLLPGWTPDAGCYWEPLPHLENTACATFVEAVGMPGAS